MDAYLEKDKNARTAVETMVKNNTVILAGEISSSATINIEQTVRNAIYKIGYNHSELGFDSHSVEIIVRLMFQYIRPQLMSKENSAVRPNGSIQEREIRQERHLKA